MRQKTRSSALCYDFRRVVPRLVKLLKRNKRRGAINNNRWEGYKDKTMSDFKDLYNKEIQFFVNFDTNAHKTYSSLYDMIRGKSLDARRTKKRRSKIMQKINTQKLVNKIRSEFVKYLCDLR